MTHRPTILTIAALLLLSSAKAQGSDYKQFAARTELHPIQTLTLSDEQFLKADTGGKSITVSGQLRIAQGAGRLPVVMLIHGPGGIGSHIDLWSREFLQMGISAFAIDGFTGRGLISVNTDQARLGRLNLIVDAYRALDIWPGIDGLIRDGLY